MVNSKSTTWSCGRGVSGKPHSKRSGPIGENQRTPKPTEWSMPSGQLRVGLVLEEVLALVVGVAQVVEHDAADADLLEDRELDLVVEHDLLVAADLEVLGRRIRGAVPDRLRRRDREDVVAAQRVDPAHEVALGDGRGAAVQAVDQAVGPVHLEDRAEGQLLVEAEEAAEAGELELAAQPARRDLGRLADHETLGGIQAVVALVPGDGGADAREDAGLELVGELDLLGALVEGRRRHVLRHVRQEESGVVEHLVAEGDVAAGRLPQEVEVADLGPEGVEGDGPVGVEEVGVDVLELQELSDRRDLRGEAGGLPPAEQVVLRDLRGEDEALQRAEAGAHLEGAGGPLLHLHVDDDQIRGAALLGGDLDGLEEAQGLHPLLAELLPGATEQLAFVEAQLAADDLVARLGVADDLDVLDVDLLPLLHIEGEVDDPRVLVHRGQRRDVGVGVALVLVDRVEGAAVVEQLGAVEELAGLDGELLVEVLFLGEEVAREVELAELVLLALVDVDRDVDVLLVWRTARWSVCRRGH